MTITVMLLWLSCAAFVAAAVGVRSRINLVAAGLAVYLLTLVLGGLGVR